MNRLRIFFAIILLMLALPLWRYLDMFTWFSINKTYFTAGFLLWSSFFLIVPISLIYKRFFAPTIMLNSCFAVLIYFFVGIFSNNSLDHPESRHCSLLNYSGFLFPLKVILPAAYEDDLHIRNQICWIRKLTLSIPSNLSKHEAPVYEKLIADKLMLPEIKWKITLPFTIPLYMKNLHPELDLISLQKFWDDHYTAEIKDREYNFLSYPHSDYIRWEYGFLEVKWRELLDSVEVKEDTK